MVFEVLKGEEMEWPACLDEYEKLVIWMNTLRLLFCDGFLTLLFLFFVAGWSSSSSSLAPSAASFRLSFSRSHSPSELLTAGQMVLLFSTAGEVFPKPLSMVGSSPDSSGSATTSTSAPLCAVGPQPRSSSSSSFSNDPPPISSGGPNRRFKSMPHPSLPARAASIHGGATVEMMAMILARLAWAVEVPTRTGGQGIGPMVVQSKLLLISS